MHGSCGPPLFQFKKSERVTLGFVLQDHDDRGVVADVGLLDRLQAGRLPVRVDSMSESPPPPLIRFP